MLMECVHGVRMKQEEFQFLAQGIFARKARNSTLIMNFYKERTKDAYDDAVDETKFYCLKNGGKTSETSYYRLP